MYIMLSFVLFKWYHKILVIGLMLLLSLAFIFNFFLTFLGFKNDYSL